MSHRSHKVAEIVEKLDADARKDDAAELLGRLNDASTRAQVKAAALAGQAKEAAEQAKDWTAPRVEAFLDWLRPRATQAWHDSVQAAAPRVEQVAAKAGPAIDTAHDKIVDEYLPKIVASFNTAAEAAADSAARAAHAASEATSAAALSLAEATGNASATAQEATEELSRRARRAARKSAAKAQKAAAKAADEADRIAAKAARKAESGEKGKHRRGLWFVVAVTTAGVGYVLYRRSQPTIDPWAEPWDEGDPDEFQYDPVGDAAEAVGEAAGATVAAARDAGEKVAGKVADTRDKVVGTVADAKDKVTEAAKEAASTAKKAAPRARKPKADGEAAADDAAAPKPQAAPKAASKPKSEDAGESEGDGPKA